MLPHSTVAGIHFVAAVAAAYMLPAAVGIVAAGAEELEPFDIHYLPAVAVGIVATVFVAAVAVGIVAAAFVAAIVSWAAIVVVAVLCLALLLMRLPGVLYTLLLCLPRRFLIQHEASFLHVLRHFPPTAYSCSIWQGLVMRLHTCALIHVSFIPFDMRKVHMSLAVGRAVLPVMVDVVPTRKTI